MILTEWAANNSRAHSEIKGLTITSVHFGSSFHIGKVWLSLSPFLRWHFISVLVKNSPESNIWSPLSVSFWNQETSPNLIQSKHLSCFGLPYTVVQTVYCTSANGGTEILPTLPCQFCTLAQVCLCQEQKVSIFFYTKLLCNFPSCAWPKGMEVRERRKWYVFLIWEVKD